MEKKSLNFFLSAVDIVVNINHKICLYDFISGRIVCMFEESFQKEMLLMNLESVKTLIGCGNDFLK